MPTTDIVQLIVNLR